MEEDPDVEQRPASGRAITSRNNGARQVVNFMPSRQLPYGTLRHRRNTSEHNVLLGTDSTDSADNADAEQLDPADQQAEIIAKELEQHQRLMEDNPVSEELRREALRDLPQGLTIKRSVRAKLSASVSLRSKRRPISVWKRLKYRISFAWKRTKDRVRDALFSIELWYEAIRTVEGQLGTAVGSYFRMLRRLFVVDLALAAALALCVALPQGLHDAAAPPHGEAAGGALGLLDLLIGTGRARDSLLFYGHYHSGRLATRAPYDMPFAYFFTMVSLYLVVFLILCYRTAYSYRRNFIETAGGLSHVFANKVFCGWDYGIVSAHAAQLNARSIYNELKELLSEQDKKQASLSGCARAGRWLANAAVTALVLACIAGLLLALWTLLERHAEWELSVVALLTAVVTVCPVMFTLVARLEYYRPRTALYVTLCRTWLLDVGVLTLLFVFWSSSGTACWETRFGQDMYRLVILDCVVSLFVLPAVEMFRAFLYKLNPSSGAPEFNIAYNSLTLIYNQSALWFGMLFSPLLALCVAIKFLILFYVKRECAMRACQPARKVWRAAQTQTVLYMLVTLSLFTTLFGIGSLFFGMSSTHCGPFRQYEYVWAVVSEGVLRLAHNPGLRAALGWLTRPGVVAFVVLVLCVLVYYTRARARAQQSMVQILRHMLVLQAKDKDFLLTAISKVSNGEWLYSPKPTDEAGPDSHTFRYLREVRKPSNSSFHFDGSRLSRSLADRPRSYAERERPRSHLKPSSNDGDTDSSFSWQGSANEINKSSQNIQDT